MLPVSWIATHHLWKAFRSELLVSSDDVGSSPEIENVESSAKKQSVQICEYVGKIVYVNAE